MAKKRLIRMLCNYPTIRISRGIILGLADLKLNKSWDDMDQKGISPPGKRIWNEGAPISNKENIEKNKLIIVEQKPYQTMSLFDNVLDLYI